MALQRYNMYIVETGPLRTPKVCSCASTETGEWVKADEAGALEKRVAELEAELKWTRSKGLDKEGKMWLTPRMQEDADHLAKDMKMVDRLTEAEKVIEKIKRQVQVDSHIFDTIDDYLDNRRKG